MFDQTDSRGIDENSVPLSVLDHLGIARYELDFGKTGRNAHRLYDSRKSLCWKPFLNDECGAQKPGPGAAHGKIVHRSADRKLPDIPARKKQRPDNIGIRGKRDPATRNRQDGPIVAFGKKPIPESRKENLLEK